MVSSSLGYKYFIFDTDGHSIEHGRKGVTVSIKGTLPLGSEPLQGALAMTLTTDAEAYGWGPFQPSRGERGLTMH